MRTRLYLFAALVTLTVAAPRPAAAKNDAYERWVQMFVEALKDGDAEGAAKLVSLLKDFREFLLEDPAQLLPVSRAVAKWVPGLGLEMGDQATEISTFFNDTAEKGLKATPDRAELLRLLAASRATRVRLAIVADKPVVEGDWAETADLTLRSYEKGSADRGLSIALASGWLREGCTPKNAAAPGLLPRMEALGAKAKEAFPDSVYAAIAGANHGLARAQVAKTPAEAKAGLDACFSALAPFTKGEPELAVGTLHTLAVTHGKANKIPVKGGYATKTFPGSLLTYSLPVSESWTSHSAGGGDSLYVIRQLDVRGAILRRIEISKYDWDTNYTDPSGDAGGDNVKGLARQDQRLRRDDFERITSEKDLYKSSVFKKLPPATCYEMVGSDRYGRFQKLRVFYVKSKENPVTFEIVLYELADMPKADPETELVLDSLVEVSKK